MLEIIEKDIFDCDVDVIVNSANPSLLAGSGLCGLIHKKAGPEMEIYCKEIGPIDVGEVVITPAFNAPCKAIVHMIAPRFLLQKYDNEKHELFKMAYVNVLENCKKHNFKSVAFPAVGVGVYGWPVEESAKIALATIYYWISKEEYVFDKIIIAIPDIKILEIYQMVHDNF